MLKTGIKKELMFFTRSFKMGGIIIAAIGLALLYPLMMKFSGMMMNSLNSFPEAGSNTSVSIETSSGEVSANGSETDDFMSIFSDENLASLGIVSSFSDITSTFLLIFMIVTMSSAGGELKKRSMIIPQNAGLSTKLYVMPKFLVYPLAAAIFSFTAMILAGLETNFLFSSSFFKIEFIDLALAAFIAAVYNAFMITLYFTLGLCMERAGIATIILYCGNSFLPILLSSFGADKFHPFAIKTEAQNLLMGGEADMVNLWGSVCVSLLIMILCYLITVFAISAKKIDNRGGNEIML